MCEEREIHGAVFEDSEVWRAGGGLADLRARDTADEAGALADAQPVKYQVSDARATERVIVLRPEYAVEARVQDCHQLGRLHLSYLQDGLLVSHKF